MLPLAHLAIAILMPSFRHVSGNLQLPCQVLLDRLACLLHIACGMPMRGGGYEANFARNFEVCSNRISKGGSKLGKKKTTDQLDREIERLQRQVEIEKLKKELSEAKKTKKRRK
jgi:hypothetical protein